jgi:multiple sugar transport system permease protein
MSGDPSVRRLALLAVPYLVGLVGLVFLPAAVTVALALAEVDFLGPARFVGLANVADLLADDLFRISLRNSLVFIALAVPLRLLGAFGLAILLHARFRAAAAYRAAAFLPSVIPDVAYALIWLWILNPLYGPLNLALRAAGLPAPAWQTDPTAAQLGIVLMSAFQVGEGFLVALAARRSIPGELYELAAVESAGSWFVFRRVTLPLMAPILALLLFRDTIFSFQATFVPAFIVTGGGPPPFATTYLPLYAYETGFEFLRFGLASTATLAMFLVTALIVYLQWRVVRRWRHALLI